MIELIAVGKEILEGATVDTNAAFIGQEFLKNGWEIARKVTIDDVSEEIGEAVLAALERSDVVITTGGIGDTHDDVTVASIAKVVDGKQQPIHNRVGKAEGAHFTIGKKQVFCLPGVPTEMKAMIVEEVVPCISLPKTVERKLMHLILAPESTVPIGGEGIGTYPKYGTLTIAFRGKGIEKMGEAEKAFPDKIYSYDDPSLEKALQKVMIEKGVTLATAESCTGGHIAASICKIPDASRYFVGSVVSYANDVKENVLGVKSLEKGAVSEEVAREMAAGAVKLTGADFAVAVTGFAGPSGGTPEKPVGTVWCAIATKKGEVWTGLMPRIGGMQREKIVEFSKNYTLASLWRYLVHGVVPFERVYPN